MDTEEFFHNSSYLFTNLSVYKDAAKICLHSGGRDVYHESIFDLYGAVKVKCYLFLSRSRVGSKEEIDTVLTVTFQFLNIRCIKGLLEDHVTTKVLNVCFRMCCIVVDKLSEIFCSVICPIFLFLRE